MTRYFGLLPWQWAVVGAVAVMQAVGRAQFGGGFHATDVMLGILVYGILANLIVLLVERASAWRASAE